MPYIEPDRRSDLRARRKSPETPGELNFVITDAIDDYLIARGLSYEQLNAVIGVLECAKMELYRRVAAPYEDGKRMSNGDVYAVVGVE